MRSPRIRKPLRRRNRYVARTNQATWPPQGNQPSDSAFQVAPAVRRGGSCLEHCHEPARNTSKTADKTKPVSMPWVPNGFLTQPRSVISSDASKHPTCRTRCTPSNSCVRSRGNKKTMSSLIAGSSNAMGRQSKPRLKKNEGIGINCKGQWGYHSRGVTPANTREPLFIANRSGNHRCHENSAFYFDHPATKALAARKPSKLTKLRRSV